MNSLIRIQLLACLFLVVETMLVSCNKQQAGPETVSGPVETLQDASQSTCLILKEATWTLELGKADYFPAGQPTKHNVPQSKLPDFTSLTLSGTVINQSSQTISAVILRFEAIGADLPRPWTGESRLLFEKPQGSDPTPDCFVIGPGESKTFRFHTAYREPKHVHVSQVRGVLIESR